MQLSAILDGTLGIVFERLTNSETKHELTLHDLLRLAESMSNQLSGLRGSLDRVPDKSPTSPDPTQIVETTETGEVVMALEAMTDEEIEAETERIRQRLSELAALKAPIDGE